MDYVFREGEWVSGRGSERILDMLEWLAVTPGPVSFTDLVRALDLPKSSALLLIRLLVERAYLERLADGTYQLRRLPGDGRVGTDAWSMLLRVAETPLRDAVDRSKESGFIAILDGDSVRYLSKILPSREIRYDRDISRPRVAHRVASGLAILSGFDEARLDFYLERHVHSSQELASVRAAVELARLEGHAVIRQGVVEGAAGIAAPIRAFDGCILAAVNLAGPRERILAQTPLLVDIVVETANRVTEELARRTVTPRKTIREDHS